MRDKVGGFVMTLLGLSLAVITIIDSLDGSFRHVSKTRGVYQAILENDSFDFYFSLAVQVGIGIIVAGLGAYISYKPKR